MAIPKVLKGRSLVIGAETGSGKTLTYLLPLATKLLEQIEKDKSNPHVNYFPPAVILVPTRELCHQVYSVAKTLFQNTAIRVGLALGKERIVMVEPIHFLIATPSSIENDFMSRARFYRNLRYLILDEADMLFSGNYLKVIEDHMKRIRDWDRRALKRAAKRKTAILNEIQAKNANDADKDDDKDLDKEDDKDIEEDDDEDEGQQIDTTMRPEDIQVIPRSFKKQYILVGATIPDRGQRSIKNSMERMFPKVDWVVTEGHHAVLPSVTQKTYRVTSESEKEDSLFRLLNPTLLPPLLQQSLKPQSLQHFEKREKTIVFVKDASTAEKVIQKLQHNDRLKDSVVGLHSNKDSDERLEAVKNFEDGKAHILVCTNVASRGLDFRNVEHVVQFDFAENVVDHLHRIGRTARAGKSGHVTNYILPENRLLFESIEAADKGSLKNSFSRRRILRRKYKKELLAGNVPMKLEDDS